MFEAVCFPEMKVNQKTFEQVWVAFSDGEISANGDYDILLHSTYIGQEEE